MDPISIGLWTTGGMLVLVFIGMRVAFAAGLAGFVGLFWLRWNGFDYDPAKFGKALTISVKNCGPSAAFQNRGPGFEPHSDIYSDRLFGLLRQADHGSF